jgi:hypothetical protein
MRQKPRTRGCPSILIRQVAGCQRRVTSSVLPEPHYAARHHLVSHCMARASYHKIAIAEENVTSSTYTEQITVKPVELTNCRKESIIGMAFQYRKDEMQIEY